MFTWVPWVLCFYVGAWQGLGICLLAQIVSLEIFSVSHTIFRRYRGAKIRHALDEIVGPVRNHLGLLITLMILPIMWIIRVGQLTIYPLQVLTLGFPWYKHREWVSVSRQKFEGLVGHDLVWCLFCEWVLSIYSFGAEMIRNNESWWCPIQFHDQDKCAKCVGDFPDLNIWVKPEGSMQEVKDHLLNRYCPKKKPRAWSGYKP